MVKPKTRRVPSWLIVYDFHVKGLSMLGLARRYGLRWAEVEEILRTFDVRGVRARYVRRAR